MYLRKHFQKSILQGFLQTASFYVGHFRACAVLMTIGESGSESQCNTYCFIPLSLDAKYELIINDSKLAYCSTT